MSVCKIALFDKALAVVLACRALAMCAMWTVGRISKFLCGGGKKLKHIRVGNECRVICLSISFFIPSLIFHFHCQFAVSLSFLRLCITIEATNCAGLNCCSTVCQHKCKLSFPVFQRTPKPRIGCSLCYAPVVSYSGN